MTFVKIVENSSSVYKNTCRPWTELTSVGGQCGNKTHISSIISAQSGHFTSQNLLSGSQTCVACSPDRTVQEKYISFSTYVSPPDRFISKHVKLRVNSCLLLVSVCPVCACIPFICPLCSLWPLVVAFRFFFIHHHPLLHMSKCQGKVTSSEWSWSWLVPTCLHKLPLLTAHSEDSFVTVRCTFYFIWVCLLFKSCASFLKGSQVWTTSPEPNCA